MVTRLARSALLLLIASGLVLAAWQATTPLRAPTEASFDRLLVAGAAWALVACAAWGWLIALTVAAEVWAGRQWSSRVACPPAVRRVLLAGCGVAVVAATPGLAHAADAAGGADRAAHARPAGQAHTQGLPVPSRPHGRADPGVAAAAATPSVAGRHQVRAGESLWAIAAQLSPEADAGEIDRRWREIYRANRDRVGSDPDLIHPGVRLDLPVEDATVPPPTPSKERP